ncbi:hypothetical protein BJ741DRAFT_613868 [Chytriomyces cf. hyalinus JEL632]|nr:hypothetical protein BJ741DRAFT_613868 [Chytriomyces cf. hyalinus JEL632]
MDSQFLIPHQHNNRPPQYSWLLRIPIEILISLSSNFLDAESVLNLTRACAQLHLHLNSNESLWRCLTFRRWRINYIASGQLWRRHCFDPAVKLLCPHLSEISHEIMAERARFYMHSFGSANSVSEIKCTGGNCPHPAPDLWMCMKEDCTSVGCGRTKNQHAMLHFATNSHHLSLKINTLEVWCYQCVKWVGKRGKSQAELERVESIISLFSATATPHSTNTPRISPTILSLQRHKLYNDRRHLERDMYVLTETDKVYFLSVEFLLSWRKFLLGNDLPPEDINNRSLVVAREDWEYVGCPEGLPNGLPLMNPYMAPFHDFGIVSEVKSFDFYLLRCCTEF